MEFRCCCHCCCCCCCWCCMRHSFSMLTHSGFFLSVSYLAFTNVCEHCRARQRFFLSHFVSFFHFSFVYVHCLRLHDGQRVLYYCIVLPPSTNYRQHDIITFTQFNSVSIIIILCLSLYNVLRLLLLLRIMYM